MTRPELEAKIRAIVVSKTGIAADRVVPEATFEDLAADSLDMIEIVMAIEDDFDLKIPDVDVETWKKFGDVVDWVAAKVV